MAETTRGQHDGDGAPTSELPEERDWTGRVIGSQLRMIAPLGHGGMGTVWLAEQLGMDRRVVVKLMRSPPSQRDAVAVERFKREARAVAQVNHPNIVQVYMFGEASDGELFLAMELVEGRTLRRELVRGPMPEVRALRVTDQICAALVEAHGVGLTHRDLKPENIMLTERHGNPDLVKVLDFGLAKLKGERGGPAITRIGAIFGTPRYMTPEQAQGHPTDARTDIYVVGVLLYEMVAGTHPFTATTAPDWITQHVRAIPEPPTRRVPGLVLSPRTEALILRCLAKDPAARPQSAAEVQREVRRGLRDLPESVRGAALASSHDALAPLEHPTQIGVGETALAATGTALPGSPALTLAATGTALPGSPALAPALAPTGADAPAEATATAVPDMEPTPAPPGEEARTTSTGRAAGRAPRRRMVLAAIALLVVVAAAAVTYTLTRHAPEPAPPAPAAQQTPQKPAPAQAKVQEPKTKPRPRPPAAKKDPKSTPRAKGEAVVRKPAEKPKPVAPPPAPRRVAEAAAARVRARGGLDIPEPARPAEAQPAEQAPRDHLPLLPGTTQTFSGGLLTNYDIEGRAEDVIAYYDKLYGSLEGVVRITDRALGSPRLILMSQGTTPLPFQTITIMTDPQERPGIVMMVVVRPL